MSTIEFYGAGGLEMTPRLTDALKRYSHHCLNLNDKWDIIGTNIEEEVVEDKVHHTSKMEKIIDTNLRLSSIPFYYQKEELNPEKSQFFSYDKVVICKKNEPFISERFGKFCQEAIEIEKEIQKKIKNILYVSSIDGSVYKIRILNIQSGDFDFWKKQLNQMLIEEDIFYIFYWQNLSGKDEKCVCYDGDNPDFEYLKGIKNKYVTNDKVWGYSQFMRDFLKIRNRCFELEYGEIKHFSVSEIRSLIDLKIGKIETLLPLDLMTNNIKNILNDFELKNSKHDFNISDLGLLHLYNRNNHFQSNYFDINFESFVRSATGSAHHLLHEKDKLLLKPNKSDILGGLESKLFFYDLFKNITDACINFKNLKPKDQEIPEFIFLDDVVPKDLKDSKNHQYWNKYQRLQDWFPGSSFFYSNERNFLDVLFNIHKVDEENLEKKAYRFDFIHHEFDKYEISNFNKKDKDNPLFIGIDIDWNGEQYGFDLLKQFRRNVHLMKRPCFIFVFSRFEYPATIRKAVASGALFYITKQNYMNLVHKVYLILRRMNPEEIINPKYRTYESWHLLNKLEPAKIVQLKSEVIEGVLYSKTQYSLNKQSHAWKWIHKLPKAELHCHIGSCLGSNLLPMTALIVLAEKCKKKDSPLKKNLIHIVEFISLLVRNLVVVQSEVSLNDTNLIKAFGVEEKSYSCVFKLIIEECKLTQNMLFPEVVLLSPQCSIIDRLLPNINMDNDYFRLRQILKVESIQYDDLMLFFILFIFIKESGIQSAEAFKRDIFEKFKKVFSDIEGESFEEAVQNLVNSIDCKTPIVEVNKLIDDLYKEENKITVLLHLNENEKTNILEHLQSSKGKSNSLFTYLRGCEYGGAAHLQTKASIYLASNYIVNQYALPDNIRYLTLRCAVDGYAKSGILNQDEAMQALLKGFDSVVKKNCNGEKRVHVDLILTAKRHKTIKEFEENVSLALQYRNGLDLPKGFEEILKGNFFNSKTKVVSFDLAGLEEGNRASKYLPQFMPLLKKCFPITIHAGEEDYHESIWEAIYLVQSQRIGHALSLRDNKDLIELVRDRHIAIELCPLSNILTRKVSYEALPTKDRNNKEIYVNDKYYPLRQYLMENLDVTINTDNPFVSGSTLTEEYLIAANLAGGLTKWEILRLIKNSFRSAAIPKEPKKLLMNEIDDEIYNLLLNDR